MPQKKLESYDPVLDEMRTYEVALRAWLDKRFSPDIIDDIVQETYARLFKADIKADVSSPKAYLFACARNVAIQFLNDKSEKNSVPFGDMDVFSIMDNEHDPYASLVRSEDLSYLTKAIQSLPSRCRQIITLRRIYNMSHKQIAEELGISESTVDTQGTIGMRKLIQYFKKHDSERMNP